MNIRKDASQLETFAELAVSNTLCLQDIGNVLSLKRCSLKRLSNDYVGIKLDKGMGHYQWDSKKDVFQYRSAQYAANDAISSLLIFRKMLSMPNIKEKNQSPLIVDVHSIKSPAIDEQISNQTQFLVKIPKKLKRPSDLDKNKFLEMVRLMAHVANNKPISFAKLANIIRLAFPKDDPLAKIKTKNIILHLLDEGVLVKK